MGEAWRSWVCYNQAAGKARVGALLHTALEAAKRELKARPQSTLRPRALETAARDYLIETVKNKPKELPTTWTALADLRESAILVYAVDEAIDAHHATHPEDGCGP